jgi:hypothetical protein
MLHKNDSNFTAVYHLWHLAGDYSCQILLLLVVCLIHTSQTH